jgi:glycerol-3-phosphate acyltransferase PlsX
MNIFIDAMGGDHAPYEIVKGSVEAVNEFGVQLTLVGPTDIVKKELEQWDYPEEQIKILHADSVISNDDEAALSIRRKTDSSIVVGIKAVKESENGVFISAGNTGAVLSGGLLLLGRIKGIKRPALGATLPTESGLALLVDTGANTDCKPEYLQQFAQIGSIYMENMYNINNPKVVLINNGTEEKKGNALTKEAYQLLKNTPVNFVGNIEGRELLTTDASVLVCDGFTGNIALKTLEGTSKVIMENVKNAIVSNTVGKIGGLLIKNNLSTLRSKFNYKEYGGAPLLGVKGGVIKSHGNSNAYVIKRTIQQGMKFAEAKVVEKITEELTDINKTI